MKTRHLLPVLVALVTATSGLALSVGEHDALAAKTPRSHVMASKTDGVLRIVLTAKQDATGATVVVSAFERTGAQWQLIDSIALAKSGAFAWSAVGRQEAVRGFSVKQRDHLATFEVLISPAVGWSNTYVYHVRGGRLVGGVQACGCAPQN